MPGALLAQTPEDGRRCDQLAGPAPLPAAVAHAERVIAGEPAGALAAFYRGCRAFAGDRGGARAAEHFERAVKLNEGSGTAHDWLGRAYGSQAAGANPITLARLAPRIRTHFERAVALDPSNAEARAYLAQYFLQAPAMLGGSEQKAWAQIAEVRKLNPYRGGLVAAQTRYQQKDKPGALQEYQAVLAQYPDSTAAMNGVAGVASELQRFPVAFAAVDGVRARHPDSRPALYTLGRLAAVSGQRLDDGAAALERFLAMGATRPGEPTLANAHFRLGNIHEKRGDRARARAAYQAALALDPKYANARQALDALR